MNRALVTAANLSLIVVALQASACNGGSGFSGTSAKKTTPAPEERETEREELGGLATVVANGTSADSTGLVLGNTDTAFDQRIEQQGAQTGDIQVTLLWNNVNDLDLHVIGPTGEHIYFAAATDSIGGYLDVDMNAGDAAASTAPIENIFWTAGQAARGQYRVYVHHFSNRGLENPSAFKVRLKVGESITFYEGSVAYDEQATFASGDDTTGFGAGGGLPTNAALVHQFNY